MKLSELLCPLPGYKVTGETDIEITDVVYDSRQAIDGCVFFCIKGIQADGHDYAAAAVERGARAVVVQHGLELPKDVTQVSVKDSRDAMALMSAAFFGNPARAMTMVGVTGTNGKTSTTYMVKSILESAGQKVGLLGTITNMIGDERIHTERTTPESVDLHRLLKRMRDEGVHTVVMEVSSHSLKLKRVAGITFDVAAFTNLTQDHLDFHGNWEDYFASKKILFRMCKSAVINLDDAVSQKMVEGRDYPVTGFGIREQAHVMAQSIEITPRGVRFMLRIGGQTLPVNLRIPGLFSVYNALAAAGIAHVLGATANNIITGLEKLQNVSGRFEVLDTHGRDVTVILDYAHSPDGLDNVLNSIKEFARGRIITMFGCGGDRDRGKRPLMGEIAGRYCDFCVITSDNPRTEQPMDIINDIIEGMRRTACEYVVIENRLEAIEYTLKQARNGDVVLLAGKGHEDYQEIHGVKFHFNDKEIVEEFYAKLDAGQINE
ncbi:MAG: UDP-N-acetylmuramoyl-L-alanyl-D-glutamate--2,6-diaminopimelate ligase [Bacillota bacterium]